MQIANALKAIHALGMSARTMDANKMLVTDEDRIRFNGCAIADILEPTSQTALELQCLDLNDFGSLILSLGTSFTKNKPMEQFVRSYSDPLRVTTDWLLRADSDRSITTFLSLISSATMDYFNASLSDDDTLQSHLNRELENSRIVRLLMKINTINERPEYEKDPMWNDLRSKGANQVI